MSIPYYGQLRFAGSHEAAAYGPASTVTSGASIGAGVTDDATVDFAGVLLVSQAATGQNAYRDYDLQIKEHGSAAISPVPAQHRQRKQLRAKYRLRIRPPGGGLAAGQRHYLAALLDDAGTTQVRVGLFNSAGTIVWTVQDVANGVFHNGGRAVAFGTWYEIDLDYSKQARLGLYTRAAGEADWTAEVAQVLGDSSNLGNIRSLRIGSLGAASTSTGEWTVEWHSMVWAFEEMRRAAFFTGSAANRFGIASNASLKPGGADFWIAGWAYLQSIGATAQVLFSRWDGGANQRSYELYYNGGTSSFRFHVSGDGAAGSVVNVDSSLTPQAGHWYFLFAWRSATDGKVYLSVDLGAPTSAAFAGPLFDSTADLRLGGGVNNGAAAFPLTGRMALWGYGTLPAGTLTDASGLATALQGTLYNGGAGVTYRELPPTFAAESGLVSFWRLDEDAGQARRDQHGSNHLAEAGTVDTTPGFQPVLLPSAEIVRVPAEEFVASRIADNGPTEAVPRLFYRAGQWRGVTHARIVYGTDPTLAAPTAGAWTDITGASAATAHILELPTLTGLAADTRHYYRWELSRDGATPHVQSDIREFCTLPGDAVTPLREHVWSCTSHWLAVLPNREIGTMLDALAVDGLALHRSFCLGDMFYEWALEAYTSAGAETVDDYVRETIETLYDPYMARLLRTTALVWMPSDHEFINEGDSRSRTDATTRARLVNGVTTQNGADPQSSYGANTTLGAVWDAAAVFIDYWCWRPWLTTDSTTNLPQASGTRKVGRVMECRLDVRYTSRNNSGYATGAATVTGSGAGSLGDWFRQVAADFNADPDVDLLVVYTEAPFTRINADPADSWREIASDEAAALTDDLADTITDPAKGVVFVVGDKHAVFWADRFFEGAAAVRAGALKLQIGVSGMGTAFRTGTGDDAYDGAGAAYVVDYWPYEDRGLVPGGATGQVKSSGAVLTYDPAAGTLAQAEYWTDYGTRYQPATLQGFQLMEAATPALQTVHAAAAVDGSGTWTAVGADDEVAALGDADPATYAQGDPLAAGQSQSRTYALEDLLAPGSAGTAIAFRIGKDDAAAAQLDCTVALLDPAGDPVAGHTWTYPDLPALDDAADTSEAITAQLGAGGYQVEFTFSRP